jgi:hypothetical protein
MDDWTKNNDEKFEGNRIRLQLFQSFWSVSFMSIVL